MRKVNLIAVALVVSACGPSDSAADAPQSAWDPSFVPIQAELLGAPGTLTNAWADIDGNGDSDLFVGFNGSPNRLYRNDDGVLTDIAEAVGVADERSTRTSAWGDFDADGDPDLLLGFPGGDAPVTAVS